MSKFIEVTRRKNDKEIINTDCIVKVIDIEGEAFIYMKGEEEDSFVVKESYTEIKSLLQANRI